MSRKLHRAARSSPSTGGKTSAIDFAASGDQTQHHGAPHIDRNRRPSHRSTLAPTSVKGNGDGSASDGTSGEDADGLQSDGSEADSEGENDGDPDVHAPSDSYYVSGKGQTGLHQDSKFPSDVKNQDVFESASDSKSHLDSEKTQRRTTPTRAPKDGLASDDEDYNGVDLISESGEEEPAVEHIEEKAIIDSEEENTGYELPLSPPNSPSFSLSSADFRDTEFEINPWPAEDPFFAEQINLINHDDFMNNTDYYGHVNFPDYPAVLEDVPRRRVRFAEPLMLPSENEETASLISDRVTAPSRQRDVPNPRPDDHKNTERTERPSENNPGSDLGGASHGDETPFEGFVSEDNEDSRSSIASSNGYQSGFLMT